MIYKAILESKYTASEILSILHSVTVKNIDETKKLSGLYKKFKGEIYRKKFDLVPVYNGRRHTYIDYIKGEIEEKENRTFINIEIVFNPLALILTDALRVFCVTALAMHSLELWVSISNIELISCLIAISAATFDFLFNIKDSCIGNLCSLTNSKFMIGSKKQKNIS